MVSADKANIKALHQSGILVVIAMKEHWCNSSRFARKRRSFCANTPSVLSSLSMWIVPSRTMGRKLRLPHAPTAVFRIKGLFKVLAGHRISRSAYTPGIIRTKYKLYSSVT